MRFPRSSGSLLHPTSLPGPYGIGDLGAEALRFVDWLSLSGQQVWQVLPLGPTGYGDSPYQCFSAFAGNPYLVSPDRLVEDGLLSATEAAAHPVFPDSVVDYGPVISWKQALLARAASAFVANPSHPLQAEFSAWCRAQSWLEDYALFMALKDAHGGASWDTWPKALRAREPKALADAKANLASGLHAHQFAQWCFDRQWQSVREYAHSRGIELLGDAPIFVSYDSADVWVRPDLFHLDAAGRPTVVAGVPPDYFSETGQLWGNPLYHWDQLAKEDFAWWAERLRAALRQVDRIRLDHFIGFTRYWEIPAGAPDARHGQWRKGPGPALFEALERRLGKLPLVAEDLGEISAEVVALRDRFEFPGMRILQFGFTGPENPFLPHQHVPNALVYSGTHDNDTALGWWETAPEVERDFARRYLGVDGHDFAWDLIRAGMMSVADGFIAPIPDLLSLGGEARMNLPGRAAGNWGWRLASGALTPELAARWRALAVLYSRCQD